jgi:hypothetical protein
MASVNVALFQIVQMYDNEWPDDLRSCGYHDEADALERFIRTNDMPDDMALNLRDIMAGAGKEKL